MQNYEHSWVGVSRRIVWRAIFLTLFMLSGIAPFQNSSSVLAQETDTQWQAYYWNNPSLTGSPVVSRQDAVLDFDWGTGSPASVIPVDQFSARWERNINVTSGNYLFTAVADDGIRLWVDGRLLINAWTEQAATTYEVSVFLSQGSHRVQVEYNELAGSASISVHWRPVSDIPTTYWKGEYFNNNSLTGAPQVVRNDARIGFDWGYESAHPLLNADGFSVRWSRTLHLPAGNYRFTARVDDGVRLFVKGNRLIDAWRVQAVTTYSADIYLDGNPATVQMDYYEGTEQAEAHLSWQRLNEASTPTPTPSPLSTATPTAVWQAQYWNNRSLSGDAVLVQQESAINYDWGDGSPSPQRVNRDNFSVRWTGQLSLDPGFYYFDVMADDGARLYINGLKRLDGWRDQSVTSYQTTLQHTGGPVSIVLEYYEHAERAHIQLRWGTSPIISPTPTPTPDNNVVLVDDLSDRFQRGGAESTWRQSIAVGYENHIFWTQNNDRVRRGNNWGRWSPQLDADVYEVFVYIPRRQATTRQARYWISQAGGFTLQVVNQSIYSDQWVTLGTYLFRGTQQDYVSLSDVTYESHLSTLVAWDAVRWEKR